MTRLAVAIDTPARSATCTIDGGCFTIGSWTRSAQTENHFYDNSNRFVHYSQLSRPIFSEIFSGLWRLFLDRCAYPLNIFSGIFSSLRRLFSERSAYPLKNFSTLLAPDVSRVENIFSR